MLGVLPSPPYPPACRQYWPHPSRTIPADPSVAAGLLGVPVLLGCPPSAAGLEVPVLLGCPLLAAGLEVLVSFLVVAGPGAGVAIPVDVAGTAGVPPWPLAKVLVLSFCPTVELIVRVPHPTVMAAAITITVRKAYRARQGGVTPLNRSSKLRTTFPPLRSSLRAADWVKVVGVAWLVADVLARDADATLRTASPADRATDPPCGSWFNAFEQGPRWFVNESIDGSD